MNTTPHLIRVEDHEYEGTCGHCGREGLRWIAILSDGSAWGTACTKKALGLAVPTPRNLFWLEDYTPAAEHTEGGVTFVLWQHKRSSATNETRNGHLTTIGGVRRTWTQRGWLR